MISGLLGGCRIFGGVGFRGLGLGFRVLLPGVVLKRRAYGWATGSSCRPA